MKKSKDIRLALLNLMIPICITGLGWATFQAPAAMAQLHFEDGVDANPIPAGNRPSSIDDAVFRPTSAHGPTSADNENSIFSSDVELLEPTYAGTGCEQESMAFSLSPDKKTASMLFMDYRAEAGTVVGQTRDQKNCTIDLPFRTPPGFRAVMTQVDVRGFNDVPSGARTMVIGGFQFIDRQTLQPITHAMNRRQIFQGPVSDEFFMTSETAGRPGLQLISACGRDFVLRINTQLAAITNAQGEQVLSTIETLDAQTHSATLPGGQQNHLLNYHLRWERCVAQRPVGRPIGQPPGLPGRPIHPGAGLPGGGVHPPARPIPGYPGGVVRPVPAPAPGHYPRPAPLPVVIRGANTPIWAR